MFMCILRSVCYRGIKTSKGPGTSDYSSLSDSQFLLGSQMWPDNSQGFTQEMSEQSRGSQHAISQEVNISGLNYLFIWSVEHVLSGIIK